SESIHPRNRDLQLARSEAAIDRGRGEARRQQLLARGQAQLPRAQVRQCFLPLVHARRPPTPSQSQGADSLLPPATPGIRWPPAGEGLNALAVLPPPESGGHRREKGSTRWECFLPLVHAARSGPRPITSG